MSDASVSTGVDPSHTLLYEPTILENEPGIAGAFGKPRDSSNGGADDATRSDG